MTTEDDIKLLAEGLLNAYGVGVSEEASLAYRLFDEAFFASCGRRWLKRDTEFHLRAGNLALSGTGFAVVREGESWGVQAPSGGKAWDTFKNLKDTFGRAAKEKPE